ncbi:hypothetical protein L3X38_000278 (mitochondrion) [Prunus dulcis]|uniref:Uncharacterized protein n=1 Tax=Prunus dulcis TaxID=3755 RepID=A0AAD4UTJ5_PRUDU|nr:hypothetical protein L3X38_000278 [Prunus dulcis]
MAFLGFEDGTIDFINTKRDLLNGTFEKELDRGIRSSAKEELLSLSACAEEGKRKLRGRQSNSIFWEWGIQVRVHSGITWRKEFARSERGSTLVEVDIESRTSWSGE